MITLKNGTKIQVLPLTDHVKYLGKHVNLVNHTDKDIEDRIRKGWLTNNEFKPQLCARDMSKKKQWLRFDSVITNAMLYRAFSWTINNYRGAKLLSAQAKLVRQIMGLHWWKSMAKREAEQQMEASTDFTTPQSSIIQGCAETTGTAKMRLVSRDTFNYLSERTRFS